MINKDRISGIELIKIIAMFIIVIAHVTEALYSENLLYCTDYVINLAAATTNYQNLLLAWMAAFGAQGNIIFFVCSAWFLLDDKAINASKVIHILADVWVINFISLLVFEMGGWFVIPAKTIIKCLLPSTFGLNWYITCYILFYLMHKGLNIIIKNLSQKELLQVTIVLLFLYYGINYISVAGHFFNSGLVVFIVVYFVIAYLKIYMVDFCVNTKKNLVGFLGGVLGTPILIAVSNFLGMYVYSFHDNLVLRWGSINSPFILLTAISLFNLVRTGTFVNRKVNYVSSLSLLVYIIHNNYLFRHYVAPVIWIKIYNNIGYNQVVFCALLYAIFLFLASLLVSHLYKKFLQKLLYAGCDKVYGRLLMMSQKIINVLINIK